ncbi:O-acetyltransferase OatA [Paraglaciecola mesophila]|uniref:O-acetyltransferase OatA n=1 Tax=Paraglaciecola mesophila TaxID=197222 RepID=A0A857JHC6_9ALTE|nr:acyltransferase family protein [Paraglaciecola mesophila]QHJ11395.1 O-acetyltransferase OatA [Paraglaciecola mesophila]
MKYRPDIDGQRAIAVILVILFHAKINLFPGGYIGVDIFFAISGFLITSIIYPKMLAGNFSFLDFYKRRARRLLPASIFMTLVTLLAFAFVYPPNLFQVLAKSAMASLLFSSNFYFWQTSSYFSPNLELQPLLHTWSLSVEEQFYFLFPLSLVILAACKLKKNAVLSLVGLACAVSLFLAYWFAPNNLSFVSFYVLPTRFYEMGLGALFAIHLTHKPNAFSSIKYLREIGLVMVAIAAFQYDRQLAFPSFYAALPVLGTLLMLIDRRTSGILYSVLCSRLFVFIGLLSYSLYLWHWPIWVFLEWLFDTHSPVYMTAYFALTFVVAYLSYRFIEQPLRQPSFYQSTYSKTALSGFAAILIASVSFFSLQSNNRLLRVSAPNMSAYTNSLVSEPFRDKCTDTKRLKGQYSVCVLKEGVNAEYAILLWGDSHASALMSALDNFSDRFTIHAMNTSGCPGLVGAKRKGSHDCHLHNEFMQQYLLEQTNHYDLILDVSAWDNYIDGELLVTESSQIEEMHAALQRTIAFFEKNQLKYVFLPQIPRHKTNVPRAFFRQQLGINTELEFVPRSEYQTKLKRFEDMLYPSKNLIALDSFFCEEDKCAGSKDGKIMYKDAHHISVKAGETISYYLEGEILNAIEGSGAVLATSVE